MNSLPLISHRMFLAAMGQKYPPPHQARPGENRSTVHTSQARVRWGVASQSSPQREPRVLVAELVPSH